MEFSTVNKLGSLKVNLDTVAKLARPSKRNENFGSSSLKQGRTLNARHVSFDL